MATTHNNHSFNIAPNLPNRDFTADHPTQKWAGDIRYVWTREGWLYLAVILYLHSRRVTGWAVSNRMTVLGDQGSALTACAEERRITITRKQDAGPAAFEELCSDGRMPSLRAAGEPANRLGLGRIGKRFPWLAPWI